jgi:CheY-like chemotaxis protein
VDLRLFSPARHPPLHVPIVALTASATPDYQQKCYAHGMDDFLSKVLFYDQAQQCL